MKKRKTIPMKVAGDLSKVKEGDLENKAMATKVKSFFMKLEKSDAHSLMQKRRKVEDPMQLVRLKLDMCQLHHSVRVTERTRPATHSLLGRM